MPLSGNDDVDLKTIAYNDAFIGDFMANLEPAAPAPSPDSAQQSVPNFYNEANNLLNLVWLENNIKSLLQSNSTDADFAKFKDNTMSDMVKQWKQRNINIKNMQSLEERASNQIENMTKKIKGISRPKPKAKSEPAPQPTITTEQVLLTIGTLDDQTRMNLKDWLNNNAEDYNFAINNLLDALKQAYPDAAKNISQTVAAKSILTAIVLKNNRSEGRRTEDDNETRLRLLMQEKEFGKMPITTTNFDF